MEEAANVKKVTIEEVTNYAKNMLLNGQSVWHVKKHLLDKGLEEDDVDNIINSLYYDIMEIRKNKLKNNMLIGALLCIGGIVLTLCDVGYIFWGAIIFGGIQFFSSLFQWSKIS